MKSKVHIKVLTVIIICLFLLSSVTIANDSAPTFTDVPETHPFFDEIESLAAAGISTGWEEDDGTFTFRPTENVTRQAMAAFLFRGLDLEVPVVAEPTFTDVDEDHFFYYEIEAMAAAGISTGFEEDDGTFTFRPSANVTRQAMAAFLFRGLDLEVPVVAEPTFTDVDEDHPFYDEIEALAASGISTGWEEVDGTFTFRPSANVTRQAMAAFLFRGLNLGAELSTYKFTYDVLGSIPEVADVEIPVTFETDVLGDLGYDNVRFAFEATGPGDVVFKATDSLGNPYEATNSGFWGPSTGFNLPADYSATTNWTLNFSKAGTYTITFSLIEAPEGDVIAGIEDSVTVEVEDANDALIDNTQLELSSDNNVVTAVVTYPDVISDKFSGYTVDALIEVLKGNVFADGTMIEIAYNGAKIGVVELQENWGEAVYLSKLIAEADQDGNIFGPLAEFDAGTRAPIVGHEGRTDTWTLTIEPADPTLSDIRVTSQVSDDWVDPIDIASDHTRVDFDVPDTVRVVDAATLERALANKDIKTIILANDITVGQDVIVQYDQTLDLDGYTLEVEAGFNLFVKADTEVTCGTIAAFVKIDEDGVTLLGPNAGIPGYEERGCEAMIQYPSGITEGFNVLVSIDSDDVTIRGFTFNDNLTVGLTYDGSWPLPLSARGIRSWGANTVVEYNKFSGFNNIAVHMTQNGAAGQPDVPATTGNNTRYNYFEKGAIFSSIYYQAAGGLISNNQLSNVLSGVQVQPYRTDASGVVSNNEILVYASGLYYNYANGSNIGISDWAFSNNTITAPADTPDWSKLSFDGLSRSFEGIRVETYLETAKTHEPIAHFESNIVDANGATTPDYWYVRGMFFRNVNGDASQNVENITFDNNDFINVEVGVQFSEVTPMEFELAPLYANGNTYPEGMLIIEPYQIGYPSVTNITKSLGYETIQAAIDDALPGNTILVAPGMYSGFHIPNGLNNITLLGANAGVSAGVDAGERGPESVIEGSITTGSGGSEWSDGLTVDGFTIKADRAFNALRTQGDIVIANNIIDGLNPDLTGTGNFAISLADFMTYRVFVKDNLIKDVRIALTDNSANLVGGEISGNVIENTLKAIEIGPGLDKIEGNVIRNSGELGLRFFASSDITAVTGNHFADNPIHVWDQRDPHHLDDIYVNNTFTPVSEVAGNYILPEASTE